MRRSLLTTATAIALFVVVATAKGRDLSAQGATRPGCEWVTVMYDRFRNTTTAEWKKRFGPDDSDLTVHAFVSVPGRSLRPATVAGVLFFRTSDSWRWLKYHDVVFLADDSIRLRPASEHDGTLLGADARVTESVSVRLTTAQLRRLARASQVEIQIGSHTEVALYPREASALRELLTIVERGAHVGAYPVCVEGAAPEVETDLPWLASNVNKVYYASACGGAQHLPAGPRSYHRDERELAQLGYRRAEPSEERCTLQMMREHERRLKSEPPA